MARRIAVARDKILFLVLLKKERGGEVGLGRHGPGKAQAQSLPLLHSPCQAHHPLPASREIAAAQRLAEGKLQIRVWQDMQNKGGGEVGNPFLERRVGEAKGSACFCTQEFEFASQRDLFDQLPAQLGVEQPFIPWVLRQLVVLLAHPVAGVEGCVQRQRPEGTAKLKDQVEILLSLAHRYQPVLIAEFPGGCLGGKFEGEDGRRLDQPPFQPQAQIP